MDILDNKSPQIGSFFAVLNELSDTIQQALQNRTPHLNGEKYLTNREVCQLFRIFTPYSPKLEGHGENTVYQAEREDSV